MCSGASSWATLGVILDVEARVVTNIPQRFWRLRSALLQLHWQGQASGDMVRMLLGHVVYSCMLFRPALSVIGHLYQFALSNGPRVASLDSFHLGEL